MIMALAAGLSIGPAVALPWSAEDLLDACADGQAYYAYGACAGYLLAVHDQHVAEGGTQICAPPELTLFDIYEVGQERFAELTPLDDESGAAFALRMLRVAYPCDGD